MTVKHNQIDVSNKRTVYFDILNVVACFGVVSMHFNGLVHSYSMTAEWRQALVVDCVFYWAVPIFFMLTGATLMGYREKYSTEVFFKKRLGKTLIPFLAWSLIALVWKTNTEQITPPVGPRSLFNMVFNTQIIDIYWFFIPLFGIYLCMPLLSLLAENKRTLAYGVTLAFLLNILGPNLSQSLGIAWNGYMSLSALSGFLIYVAMGWLLKDWSPSLLQKGGIYILGIAGVLVRYFGTIIASDKAGQLINATWGYLNVPSFLESLAVFVLAKSIKWDGLLRSRGATNVLAKISSCSFGVYLIHMFVFWYGLKITGLDGASLLWRAAGPVVAYFLCLCITFIGKQIPYIKRLFP